MNNYQQLNLKKKYNNKKRQKQTKQTTIIGTDSQVWRSFERLSAGRGKWENGRKGAGTEKVQLVGTGEAEEHMHDP